MSLPLLDAIVAMNPGDENLHLASAARRRHGRWCHMSSLRAPSDTLASRSTTRWRSRSKLRCNLAGLVATAEPNGRRPAKSGPSSTPRIAVIRAHFIDVIDSYYHHSAGEEGTHGSVQETTFRARSTSAIVKRTFRGGMLSGLVGTISAQAHDDQILTMPVCERGSTDPIVVLALGRDSLRGIE